MQDSGPTPGGPGTWWKAALGAWGELPETLREALAGGWAPRSPLVRVVRAPRSLCTLPG